MKQFNVLDRNLNLYQHHLLEASAGTGKTFSIQNIVVRLLIDSQENHETLLQQILVVTFTRAATRDLKLRIRSNIEKSVSYLEHYLYQHEQHIDAPDFLIAFMEKGADFVKKSMKRLQQSLFTFDQSQIFTIHSFCARMLRQYALESDMGLHSVFEEESLPQSEIMSVIRDFFRTEIREDQYSPFQLDVLMKGDPHQKKLLRLIQTNYEFPFFPSFKEVHANFVEKMQLLKRKFQLESEKMIADFRLLSNAYRNHKSGETKAETFSKVTEFAKLFDKEDWNLEDLDRLIQHGLVWVKALDIKFLKNKLPLDHELSYPSLTQQFRLTLENLIEPAGNFAILLARMASDCRCLLKNYQLEEEKLSPDDVLRKMHLSLNQDLFLKQVQSQYQIAIIDEFQDTDPLQWEIFRKLFLSTENRWNGYLYLVGDPKQSIYSFRQADIYTYLDAAQALGESQCFSLSVNYRSQPNLVDALNTLFSPLHLPHFIPLPKKSNSLSYLPVQASPSIQNKPFNDKRGAIHFFIADGQNFKRGKLEDLETDIFFPFIAQEILQLKNQQKLDFRQFSILVRDRYQALRLAKYLEDFQIPYHNQRGTSLAYSEALQTLKELIRAILHPADRGTIRTVLGNALMGWTYEEIKQLESMESIFMLIQGLRRILFENGFALFFQELLESSFYFEGETIQERILARKRGLEFYHDLQQIADIVVSHQFIDWDGPEGLIPFLDRFQLWDENDDDRVKRFQDSTTDQVKILTLHFSKGLEFDVVFALGLVNRTILSEDFVPVESEGKLFLKTSKSDVEGYLCYCEETDAEKMRQFYVALTRAKDRLYIPVALNLPSEKLNNGEASPMDLYLARLCQSTPSSYKELYDRIKSFEGAGLFEFLETIGRSHFISHSIHQEVIQTRIPPLHEEQSLQLFSPDPVTVPKQFLSILSFTAMSHQVNTNQIEKLTLSNLPHDYHNILKNVHSLPANSETGKCIHYILEKCIYKEFKTLKHLQQGVVLIQPFIEKTIFKQWEIPIATLIFNTLRTELPQLPGKFCLADLEPIHHYREMSFMFSYHNKAVGEDLEVQDGLIKGVIDLLFYHEGLYYLVDWKTNWLGDGTDAYSIDSLKKSMNEHFYYLQSEIYTEAVKRYLMIVEPRPFEECFGGVLYLFMRGMQPGLTSGIYHFFPSSFIPKDIHYSCPSF